MIPRSEVERWRVREVEERGSAEASRDVRTADAHRAKADQYATAIQRAEDAAKEEIGLGLRKP